MLPEQHEATRVSGLRPPKKTSKYWGVSWCSRIAKHKAVITFKKVQYFLGYFQSEDMAALAYDQASYKLRGSRAKLNFPDMTPSSNTQLVAHNAKLPDVDPEELDSAPVRKKERPAKKAKTATSSGLHPSSYYGLGSAPAAPPQQWNSAGMFETLFPIPNLTALPFAPPQPPPVSLFGSFSALPAFAPASDLPPSDSLSRV